MEKILSNNEKVEMCKNKVYVLSEIVNPISKDHNTTIENGTGVIYVSLDIDECLREVKMFSVNMANNGFLADNSDDIVRNKYITYRCDDEEAFLKLDIYYIGGQQNEK